MRLHGSLWWIILLGALNLFGDVRASLLQSSISSSESATLILSASGENIKFPLIEQIDGYSISSKQSRQSIEFINGNVTKKIDQFLTFYPDKNITIPSYTFLVDGKEEKTAPLILSVTSNKEAIAQDKQHFSLDMNASNLSPLQQEAVKLTLTFKRNKSENVLDMRLTKPIFDGFWVKEAGKENPYVEGDFIVHVMHYLIYPQKSGLLTLPPAKIEVARQSASRDIFMNQIQWKTVISNEISLNVQPLEGTHLLGHFSMDITSDKEEIGSNETANVTLKIVGEGNFEDLEAFKLEIKNGVVFSDTPQIKTWLDGDKLKGEFIQKFAINAQTSFDIPSFSLKYFDANKRSIQTTQTKPLAIHVKESAPIGETHKGGAQESKKEMVREKQWQFDVASFCWGGLVGIVLLLSGKFLFSLYKQRHHVFPKENKLLLQKILKYKGKNETMDEWILKLEENLYKGAKHPIHHRKIKQLLEDFV